VEFDMPKSFSDTKDGVILEPRAYRLRLIERAVEENKAGTGENIVLDLEVFGEGDPFDGIGFRYWLSLPNATDEGRTTRQNQPMVDWKMQRIEKIVKALGGQVRGSKFSIPDTATCKAMIAKIASEEREGEFYNRLDGDLLPDDSATRKSGGVKKT
jgi:hypothetical protein